MSLAAGLPPLQGEGWGGVIDRPSWGGVIDNRYISLHSGVQKFH